MMKPPCVGLRVLVNYGRRNLQTSTRPHEWMSRCCYSTIPIMNVFDRQMKIQQKDLITKDKDYQQYSYVKDEIGFRVFDRLCDVKRTFGTAVDLGCGLGHVTKHITLLQQLVTDQIYMIDGSAATLVKAETSPDVPCTLVHCDEETLSGLPFELGSIDVVYSSLSLHWINDMPGMFRRVMQILKNDGVFVGSLFGTDTLYELRVSLQLAEHEIRGGISPHISPFTAVRDMGDLMGRAGYSLVTLDADEIVVNYPGIWELMRDLKGMGESNCSWSRPLTLRRDVINRAEEIYRERYGNSDGSIPASFCILSFIGWKPDPSQPKPAARGSATVSIKDLGDIVSKPDNGSDKSS